MSRSTESIRWGLLDTLERAFYTGTTAGQPWLGEASAFVHGLHRNDPRLIRLAILGESTSLHNFIATSPPNPGATFRPSRWLDGYVGWAASLP